jgi:flagellin-like hook-associated protein FlgL
LAVKVGGATTIQDILDLINNHPQNADGKLVARLALRGNGIELADDSQGSGTLRVTRSQMSTAAIDLGLVPAGANNSLPAAADGHAATTIASTAKKSGLVFSAVASGTAANGVRVVLQDGGPAAPAYDGLTKTLTIGITAGVTRAADVAAMLAASPLGATFAAGFDPADNSGNDGTGTVAATDPLDPPTTAGGTATAYAAATVASAGYDNDLILTARNVGTAQNDIQIRFIEVPGGPTAVASYTPGLELVFQIDPGVSTANDVIAALAAHPAANADFAAALDPADASPNDGSGLVDATTGAEPAMSGGQQTLAGTDVNPRETDSLFTALVRIRDGLQADDLFLVQRSLDLLERKVVDLNFSRAGLGAQQQGLDVLRDRLDTEDVELQQSLSLDYDADLAAVVTDLSSRQAAFEAALQATARTYGMSLLNYL